MRRILLVLLALASMGPALCASDFPTVFAHRGCHLDGYVPENSLDGIAMAARYGYPTVEIDVKFSSDSALVVMHDKTVNRTMVNAGDLSKIADPVKVSDHSLKELRENYVLASSDPAMRKPIPLLEEMLRECRRWGIVPILHCKIFEGYELAQEILGDDWIAFASEYDICNKVRELNRNVLILYSLTKGDNSTPEEVITKLKALGGRTGISTMESDILSSEMIKALGAAGYETQSSIFKTPREMKAIHDGASIILSDFCWFQTKGRKPSAKSLSRGRTVSGDIFEASADEMEFGAMTIEIKCKGEYDLTVNGERKYHISHERMDREALGFRMYKTTPYVVLEATGDKGRVRRIKVNFYTL